MVHIEIGNIDQVPAICAILIDTWKNGYRNFMPLQILDKLNLDSQIRRHEKYFNSGIQYVVALNEMEELVGFGSYGKNRMGYEPGGIELYTLFVGMKNQGKGIGQKILTEIVNKVNVDLVVSVFEKNPYKKFYANFGFKNIGTRTIELMGHELDCQMMRLNT